jgi:hypothetical protein
MHLISDSVFLRLYAYYCNQTIKIIFEQMKFKISSPLDTFKGSANNYDEAEFPAHERSYETNE